MLVSPPEFITETIDGIICEPYEKITIESSPEVILFKLK